MQKRLEEEGFKNGKDYHRACLNLLGYRTRHREGGRKVEGDVKKKLVPSRDTLSSSILSIRRKNQKREGGAKTYSGCGSENQQHHRRKKDER